MADIAPSVPPGPRASGSKQGCKDDLVDVLDNPVWHALTGPQRGQAEGSAGAVRMRPESGPWAALPDHPTAECWAELGALIGPDGGAVLIRPGPIELPHGWATLYAGTAVQMTAPPRPITAPARPAPPAPPAPDRPIEVLGMQDVPQMLELVEATKPGPFAERTIGLGTYLGIRRDGRLVAIAGERLRPPGHVEISAVCTDVEHRGLGYGAALVISLVAGIAAAGWSPILHVAKENVGANRLYRKLGFEERRELSVLGVRAPG